MLRLFGVTVPLPENHRLLLASSISYPGHLSGEAMVGHLSCHPPPSLSHVEFSVTVWDLAF